MNTQSEVTVEEDEDYQMEAHPRKRIKLKARRGVTPSEADMDWTHTEDLSVQTQ